MKILTEYNVVYLLCNVLRTYAIFRFMRVFLGKEDVKKTMECVSYILCYVAVSSIYIVFNNPLLTALTNIITILLITFSYKAKNTNRIFGVIFTYAMLILVDFLAYWGVSICDPTSKLPLDKQLIIMQIIATMLIFTVVILLSNIKNSITVQDVLPLHWIASIMIPFITTILAISPLLFNINVGIPLISLIIVAMFLVNVVIFYLYDELKASSQDKLEKGLVLQQSNIYKKQLDFIYQSQENIKAFRHDMKNHLTTIQTLITDNENDKAIIYIENTFDVLSTTLEHCHSGNYVIDSILNFKISQSITLGITVDTIFRIPKHLNISAFDLNVVIANLMDNAITAASKTSDKYISIRLHFHNELLFINITNSYNGIIKKVGKQFITMNENPDEHGIGIKSVEQVITKYNGEINFSYDKHNFAVNAMLFNEKITNIII